ncbi:zinc ribbon domain-containing protein [Streptomyces sp. NBC_01589]|uniref:zinc ribbon domain-containing protein n=1 Tax=Streptomyces sp. NBC_01589 TaxID=2975886 RepID=UPI00386A99BF
MRTHGARRHSGSTQCSTGRAGPSQRQHGIARSPVPSGRGGVTKGFPSRLPRSRACSAARIGPFSVEPTSQVCCVCGIKDGPNPLHVRVWECGACGAVPDRDINAAVNVAKAAGLAVSACGASSAAPTRPLVRARSRRTASSRS